MTPGDLRAEIAKRQLRRYDIAAEVGVHPSRLGQMLNERIPMPADVVERVKEALRALAVSA